MFLQRRFQTRRSLSASWAATADMLLALLPLTALATAPEVASVLNR